MEAVSTICICAAIVCGAAIVGIDLGAIRRSAEAIQKELHDGSHEKEA